MASPIILRHGQYGPAEVDALKQQSIQHTTDAVELQLSELFEIVNPSTTTLHDRHLLQKFIQHKYSGAHPDLFGDWIYYPWSQRLVHSVPEDDFLQLRTNRNQMLITTAEQQRIYQSTIGVAGLSIGSHFAKAMVSTGIGKCMKLADYDTLSTSNLNRIGATIADIGLPKLQIISQQLYENNPYQKIVEYPQGLEDRSLNQFVLGEHRADIIFEALDDFAMKVKLRMAAQQAKIPVVMITNLGDTVLIDIERYDHAPQPELFNGLVDGLEAMFEQGISEQDKVKLVKQIIPPKYMSKRILASLSQLGTSLVGRPQLASTVAMGGGVAALVGRLILLGRGCPSGRYRINIGRVLGDDADLCEHDLLSV